MNHKSTLRQRLLLPSGLICALLINVAPSTAQPVGANSAKQYTSNLPFPFPDLPVPNIPDKSFNIVLHGAIGDGVFDNTEAIAATIDECSRSGGGKVIVPPGMWLTGPIKLQSHLNLVLERGAVVLFSKHFTDYPLVNIPAEGSECKCISPLSGVDLTDIAITGEGMIDGSGEVWRPMKKSKFTSQQWKERLASGGTVSADGNIWWPSAAAANGEEYLKNLKKERKKPSCVDYEPAREYLRPNLVKLVGCKNILIDGPVFANSPAWDVNPVFCENVVVRNIRIRNEWSAQNGDGIDFKSCRNVVMTGCTVEAGDDGICLKSGGRSPSKELVPCENVVIADCIVYHAHGGFVIGSTVYGGIKNVSVRNCTFVGTDVGLRFKSSRTRGGVVENIVVDGVVMTDIRNEAIKFEMYYEDSPSEQGTTEDRTPQFRKITMKNIVCNGAKSAGILQGLPESALRQITVEGYTAVTESGLLCEEVDGVKLNNVTLVVSAGSLFSFRASRNLSLEKAKCPQDASPFISVEGEKNSNIQLVGLDMSAAKKDVAFTGKAQPSAVIRK